MTGRSVELAVVGAGWAGLAAAITACQAGLRVALIDAAPQAGGRARQQVIDFGFGPIELDNGQHLLIGAYRDTLSLIESIGESSANLFERRPMALHDTRGLSLRTARLPAPLHLLWALISASGLSLRERLAMVRLMSGLRRCGWRVPAGETVNVLLERYSQPMRLRQHLWEPLCVSALNTLSHQACSATFATVLRDSMGATRAASDFLLPRQSLGECLPAPALRWLQQRGGTIFLRSPVRSLSTGSSGWQVLGESLRIEAQRLILACGPANAQRLLEATQPRDFERQGVAASELGGLRTAAIATTWLAWPLRDGPSVQSPLMLAAPHPDERLADWLFDRGSHHGYRVGALVSSAADSIASLKDRPNALHFARAVCEQQGLPEPSHARLIIERRATFLCEPYRPVPSQPDEGTLPGLWLAGDYTERHYPATLEAAVRSGRRAAQSAIRSLLRAQSQASSIA